jgi:stress response protein YsnF
MSYTLVGVYATPADADRVRARLVSDGIPESDLRLSRDKPAEGEGPTATATDKSWSFWDWLFGTDVPEEDRNRYESTLHGGRTAVSVRLADVTRRSRIEGILEEFDPIDVHGGTAAAVSTPAAEGEQRIPVTKEELEVGKRRTEQRYRIRVYPVERPAEEQVNLRDERVEIERRPMTGQRAADESDLQARDVEVVERHEEPVVGKKSRATEEVVVRKDVEDRTETARDTVREMKVDIEKSGADKDPGGNPRQ